MAHHNGANSAPTWWCVNARTAGRMQQEFRGAHAQSYRRERRGHGETNCSSTCQQVARDVATSTSWHVVSCQRSTHQHTPTHASTNLQFCFCFRPAVSAASLLFLAVSPRRCERAKWGRTSRSRSRSPRPLPSTSHPQART
jgi:hypothetical protein